MTRGLSSARLYGELPKPWSATGQSSRFGGSQSNGSQTSVGRITALPTSTPTLIASTGSEIGVDVPCANPELTRRRHDGKRTRPVGENPSLAHHSPAPGGGIRPSCVKNDTLSQLTHVSTIFPSSRR